MWEMTITTFVINLRYVLDEDGFRHGVQVQTGATIDGYTVIEDGLKEGDKVVIAK